MFRNSFIVLTLLLAGAMYWLGTQWGNKLQNRTPRWVATLVGVLLSVPGIVFALYYLHLFDHWLWFYWLRAVPGSELLASGLGLLAGLLNSRREVTYRLEKVSIPMLALLVVLTPHLKALLLPVPLDALSDEKSSGVCLQSTPSTCGPACAATILRMLGQPVSERAMAEDSYSSRRGTEIWYLARAVRRRGLHADFEFHSRIPGMLPSPAIAGVVLRGGKGHFIAILRSDPSNALIADPLWERRTIRRDKLEKRYHFTGFFMLIRPYRPIGNQPTVSAKQN